MFLAPRYWPLWSAFALLYPVTRLPLAVQQKIGSVLGMLLYRLAAKRRHFAAVNIELCFPELSENERTELLARHFRHHGIYLVETFTAWWANTNLFNGKVIYEGLEHLDAALAEGNGVLLLGSHFSTLEIGIRLIGERKSFDIMYRPHRNPLFESVMCRGRMRCGGKMIDRRNVRLLLDSLRNNNAVWYGPDQDYGRKHSVFVPFMGNIAATVTGTSRISRISGAPVVPYFVDRLDGSQYHVRILPKLEKFPTGDPELDATTINRLIEHEIRKRPESYLWTHRRFKTRPQGVDRPY